MRSATTASILLSGLARALVIPTDLDDGAWAFTPGAGAAPTRPLARRQQGPPPLPSPVLQCGAGYVNGSELAAAREGFSSVCDQGRSFPAGVGIVVARGSTLAYMCNGAAENRCWRFEFDQANGIMDGGCGSGRAGMVRIPAYSKAYGRASRGDDIC
ncbi:hypothetical protein GGTG_00592 [Gaeumannomyces tritici R3-111a-1]|uniref:Ecp2 effector protein domain-containing protein n=1 Tax=Gaeumannomyces tritici (strain R3-111a-1) TaxID=644352 RepID=J3NH54_GAET3|nr:hypothetical protein GGTG_00592 [Gaeumannomyces tritici R3-111a-1]EJT80597.1 hypothetical protein GGTG_00592 [Gaeumannomyces tritici R3-111a-1]